MTVYDIFCLNATFFAWKVWMALFGNCCLTLHAGTYNSSQQGGTVRFRPIFLLGHVSSKLPINQFHVETLTCTVPSGGFLVDSRSSSVHEVYEPMCIMISHKSTCIHAGMACKNKPC